MSLYAKPFSSDENLFYLHVHSHAIQTHFHQLKKHFREESFWNRDKRQFWKAILISHHCAIKNVPLRMYQKLFAYLALWHQTKLRGEKNNAWNKHCKHLTTFVLRTCNCIPQVCKCSKTLESQHFLKSKCWIIKLLLDITEHLCPLNSTDTKKSEGLLTVYNVNKGQLTDMYLS